MESIVKIRSSELSLEYLERYPVWEWDEGDFENEDLITPVETVCLLANQLCDVFVKTTFVTPEELVLEGYVGTLVDSEVYMIELFLNNKCYAFNNHKILQDMASESLQELRRELGNENAVIFPLRYESPPVFANGETLVGVFDIKI